MADDLPRTLLSRIGTLGHIRLARGVVGKASVIAGIGLLVLGGISVRIDPGLLLIMAGAVVLLFFGYLAAVLWVCAQTPGAGAVGSSRNHPISPTGDRKRAARPAARPCHDTDAAGHAGGLNAT